MRSYQISADMPQRVTIADVQFTAAGTGQARGGLVGWVAFTVNKLLKLDGIAVRRTTGGRPALTFPSRHDGARRQHFYVRPIGDHARHMIEEQVFAAIGYEKKGNG